MQISDTEVRRILGGATLIEDINSVMDGIDEPVFDADPEMIARITKSVMEMPDREDRIAELKAKIDAGEYRVTSAEIVDAMVRRAIADRVR